MDNMITTITSTVAAVTSIASIIVILIQGKKNRRLKSLTEFKIKCLNKTIAIIMEYWEVSYESLFLNIMIKGNNTTDITDERLRELKIAQRLLFIKYELGIWINYENTEGEKVNEELENFSKRRSEINENYGQDVEYSLTKEAEPLISALKNYIQEEWRLINKEL
ncbi:hypothetical protein [Carnobacterium divergens]|uniref:hypothetical protein n=1 Tax=Carnobacterium divergens TaxID=2748 RepID=UPI0039AFC59D